MVVPPQPRCGGGPPPPHPGSPTLCTFFFDRCFFRYIYFDFYRLKSMHDIHEN
jgi:hypothetical protein